MELHRVLLVCAFALPGLLGGCGSGGSTPVPTVRVTGVVTLDGKPLAGAEVRFIAEKFTGFAVTNTEGKYSLVQGAVPGVNKIQISKIEGGKNVDPTMAEDAQQLRMAAAAIEADGRGKKIDPKSIPHEVVPSQYNDPVTTKLTFTVPENGATDANFAL